MPASPSVSPQPAKRRSEPSPAASRPAEERFTDRSERWTSWAMVFFALVAMAVLLIAFNEAIHSIA